MKRRINTFSILYLLLIFHSLGFCLEPAAKKTVWLDDRYSALYPENVYLVGVGKVQIIREEYPEKKADAAARKNLTDKIKIMLKYSAKDIFQEKTSQEITEITDTATGKIARMVLGKVIIGARWIDKKDNSLYSVAVIKYSKLVQSVEKQSDRLSIQAKGYYKSAKNYFNKKKIFSCLESYIQTLQVCDEFSVYKSALQFLQDRFDIEQKIKVRELSVTTSEVEEKIEDIISSIKLEKLSGDFQEVSSGVLPQHIRLKVLYNNAGVADFPTNFSLPDGNAVYTPNIRSDEKGIVECGISNITEGKKINRVVVTPDLPLEVEGRESSIIKWQKQLSKKQVEFIYFVFSPAELREWIDDVALSMAKQSEKHGKLSIIVEDFVMNDGTENKLCKYFPDLLVSQISSIGRENLIVKRIHDVKKKRKEAIITGIFTEIGSGVTVSARLDNYKGEYLAGSNITARRTDEINALLGTTEPVAEEAPPKPLYQPRITEPAEPKEKLEPVEKEKITPEPEKIKEKPPEVLEQVEKVEEEPVIKLKKRKRKRPRIRIIE